VRYIIWIKLFFKRIYLSKFLFLFFNYFMQLWFLVLRLKSLWRKGPISVIITSDPFMTIRFNERFSHLLGLKCFIKCDIIIILVNGDRTILIKKRLIFIAVWKVLTILSFDCFVHFATSLHLKYIVLLTSFQLVRVHLIIISFSIFSLENWPPNCILNKYNQAN